MFHLETILPGTLGLLKEISALPAFTDMRLVGGTALALLLGHRKSIDLDFFGSFDETISLRKMMSDAEHSAEGSESGAIQTVAVDGVKIDAVNYPYRWLRPPVESDCLRLADFDDIAAMKLSAAANRGRKKDFIDLFFLLRRYSLTELFALYRAKFNVSDIAFPLRGLTYYEDAETDPMPDMLEAVSWDAVKAGLCSAVRNYTWPTQETDR